MINIKVIDKKIVNSIQVGEEKIFDGTDALITKQKNVCLIIFLADCVGVLIYDKKNSIVAAVHAGWRGTVLDVTEKTIEKMIHEFRSEPTDIFIGISPSIGPCCFEIGDNVAGIFEKKYPNQNIVTNNKNKNIVDLWKANKTQILNCGILENNIEIASICTICSNKDFFSARKDGKTGRFMAGIMLR